MPTHMPSILMRTSVLAIVKLVSLFFCVVSVNSNSFFQ